MNAPIPDSESNATAARPSRLWWWFVLAFVLQAAAWTTWFVIASRHRVEEVPLITNGR